MKTVIGTSFLDPLSGLGDWVILNINNLIFSAVTLVAIYVAYRFIAREIRKLKDQAKLQDHLASTLTRVAKWGAVAVAFSAVLAQWGVTLGAIAGLLALYGGTVVGFAAINTLGNAIAGLIVMTSRPFRVGERIFFNGQFADVISIELIYTKMVTLDNVLISIPNQELLKAEIDNFGRERVVRRHCTVTPGFEHDSAHVEKVLLDAAGRVAEVLQEPKPYVWITQFQSYAVEYTLYVFTSNIKRLPEIDAELYRKVLETCKEYGIDISTPMLLKQVKQ